MRDDKAAGTAQPAGMARPALRVDKWLWFSRLAKTRSVARKLVEEGAVTVNGRTVGRASALVHPGDSLTVTRGRVRRAVRVTALAEARGGAPLAAALYEDEGTTRIDPYAGEEGDEP